MSTQSPAAVGRYREVGVETGVLEADPHRLIQLLMEGTLERLHAARGCMERGEMARKGQLIGGALSIVGVLRGALDMERGGEIASNLDRLYEYMERRLLEANLRNDPSLLDEVAGLLREIKEAWDAIPAILQRQGQVGARQAGS